MKIEIDNEYINYADFIKSIPSGKYKAAEVYCNKRNRVELVEVDGRKFVVKRYKKPTFFNRVAYTFFRKDKSCRSFYNAKMLERNGIETAKPVAYIIVKRGGLLHTAYFVSEYLPYKNIREVYAVSDEQERKELNRDFVNFTLRMHRLKIVHKDYNPGNILVHKENDGYHFALIDINRMSTGKVPGLKTSMRAFNQLGIDVRTMLDLYPEYADARNFDLEKCVFFTLLSRAKYNEKRRLKNIFKQRVLGISNAKV
jgi:serine/threonine protein kinase